MMQALEKLRVRILVPLNRSIVKWGKGSTFGRGTTFGGVNGLRVGKNVSIGKYGSIKTDAITGIDVMTGNHGGNIGKYDHHYTIVRSVVTSNIVRYDTVGSLLAKQLWGRFSDQENALHETLQNGKYSI